MKNRKLYTLNYQSILNSELDMDIETYSFNTRKETLSKVLDLIINDSDCVYTAQLEYHLMYDTNEIQSALITRKSQELYFYVANQWEVIEPFTLFIFEWKTYKEALDFLKDCFETSSKMYKS